MIVPPPAAAPALPAHVNHDHLLHDCAITPDGDLATLARAHDLDLDTLAAWRQRSHTLITRLRAAIAQREALRVQPPPSTAIFRRIRLPFADAATHLRYLELALNAAIAILYPSARRPIHIAAGGVTRAAAPRAPATSAVNPQAISAFRAAGLRATEASRPNTARVAAPRLPAPPRIHPRATSAIHPPGGRPRRPGRLSPRCSACAHTPAASVPTPLRPRPP